MFWLSRCLVITEQRPPGRPPLFQRWPAAVSDIWIKLTECDRRGPSVPIVDRLRTPPGDGVLYGTSMIIGRPAADDARMCAADRSRPDGRPVIGRVTERPWHLAVDTPTCRPGWRRGSACGRLMVSLKPPRAPGVGQFRHHPVLEGIRASAGADTTHEREVQGGPDLAS